MGKGRESKREKETQIETGQRAETEAHTAPHVSEMQQGPFCVTIQSPATSEQGSGLQITPPVAYYSRAS